MVGAQLGIDSVLIFLTAGRMGLDMKTGLKMLGISNIFMALGGSAATFIASARL